MIRLIHCVRRRSDVPPEEFRRLWQDPRFARLVDGIRERLNARRSAMNLTLDVAANQTVRAMRGSAEPFDAVIEYWWDHASDLLETAASEASRALLEEMTAYQRQFVDFGASVAFFTEG